MLERIKFYKTEIGRLQSQKYIDFSQRYRLAKLKFDLAILCCNMENLEPTLLNVISVMGHDDWNYVIRYLGEFNGLILDSVGIKYLNKYFNTRECIYNAIKNGNLKDAIKKREER